ncbi:MAG TPA: glycoside hydrolase family 3 C-terminal domain-containing protein [Puia sp.]|jgi:beta-glucosidase
MKKNSIVLAALFAAGTSFAQGVPVYKDSTQPIDKRVSDLLSRMTPEEKFWQLFMLPGNNVTTGAEERYYNGIFGFQVSAVPKKGDAGAQMLDYGVTDDAKSLIAKINGIQKYLVERSRLGIPMIAFDEALHGLVRGGATVFPQAIGLAATWDTALVARSAAAIAAEARLRGIRDILSPVINIAADPRWGRVEETYGEDPLLTSAMAVSFVRSFEDNGVVTTPKHFIANVGDGGRDSYPIEYDQRLLEEVYLPPFRACIEKGGSRSIMTAYNSLDGTPCSANSWLLTKKLKGDWNFKGFTISDANAVGGNDILLFTSPGNAISAEQSVNAGLDVIFQTSYEHHKLFIPHFLDGGIDPKRIDDAVSRVLKVKFELGLFEHPYVTEADQKKWNDPAGNHKALARQAALESIVLLKNDSKLLPLPPSTHSIAVIGPDAVEARLGGYSGPGNGKVNILDGIRQRAGEKIRVSYTPGCGRETPEWAVIPADCLGKGLTGEYFNNLTLTGPAAVTRTDKVINFQWTLYSPAPAINHDYYSARWTGTLHAPKTGRYRIGLDGDDGYRLYLDDKLVIDNWTKRSYSTRMTEFPFEQGHDYAIRVEFFEPVGNAHLKLIWNVNTGDDWNTKIEEAVTAAAKADVAVIVAGIKEGEFQDRASLALPGHQEELIRRVAATGKPVVVLLTGGSAITLASWLDKAGAIVDVWYPGEEGGNAVASILFGDYNPAGRLPISFPVTEAQLPWVYDHKPTGRGDDYNNLTGLPQFPFGYGLSYTHFEYSDLRLDHNEINSHDSTLVHCTIKNTGEREGDEVVQLYTHEEVASVTRPVLELKGFFRIHLRPGESRELSFMLSPANMQSLDKELHWTVEPGDYRIMIGASSRDLRLKGTLTVR